MGGLLRRPGWPKAPLRHSSRRHPGEASCLSTRDGRGFERYTDPYARHEARWISQGRPSALIRDRDVEGNDPAPDGPFTVVPVRVQSQADASNGADVRRPTRPSEDLPMTHNVQHSERGKRQEKVSRTEPFNQGQTGRWERRFSCHGPGRLDRYPVSATTRRRHPSAPPSAL
jgi:hypothetical protein